MATDIGHRVRAALGKVGGWFAQAVIATVVSLALKQLWSCDGGPSTSVVSIDRPGSLWGVAAYCAACALAVIVLLAAASRYLPGRNRPVKRIVALVAASAAVALVALAAGSDLLLARVGSRSGISGRLNDRNYTAYLFVRPVDSDTCWLQSPSPLQPESDGTWRAVASFAGVPGKRELIAVASTGGQDPKPFPTPGSYRCDAIPRNWERSVRLVWFK